MFAKNQSLAAAQVNYQSPQSALNQPSTADAPNAMEAIIGALKEVHERSGLVRDQLQRIISRAFGEAGQPPGPPAAAKPIAVGSVSAIAALLVDVGEDLSAIEQAVTRLDGLA
jgi:hypothetical protein